jgi:hypothetical protein
MAIVCKSLSATYSVFHIEEEVFQTKYSLRIFFPDLSYACILVGLASISQSVTSFDAKRFDSKSAEFTGVLALFP